MRPDGRVVASSDPSAVGRDDSREEFFRRGRAGVSVADPGRDASGRVRWVVAAPILSRRSGTLLGVLGNRVTAKSLSDLTTGRTVVQLGAQEQSMRRGNTGEVYIVDRHGVMLTESRFLPGAVLNTTVRTAPVRLALAEGRQFVGDYADYRGVRVTGAAAVVPENGWVVVAEIDAREAQEPARRLRINLLLVGAGLLPALGLLGFVLQRSIARPLWWMIDANERVTRDGPAAGLLDERATPYLEWRRLIAMRNAMLTRVDKQASDLREQLEKERFYHAAQDADRRKDRFLAMLSHELRTPLGAITNAVHALDHVPAEEARMRLRGVISRQVRYISRLMDDLLDVSRIGAGKVALRVQLLDLREVAQRAVEAIEAIGRAESHRISLDLSAERVGVEGDAARLEQIVRNLVENAIKYSRADTVIRIAVHRDRQEAVTTVTDQGVGIAPEDLSRIFEPFVQTEASVEQRRGGLGLGLPLVRGLVELHHGRMTVASAGPGRGSEFSVRLPLVLEGAGVDFGDRVPEIRSPLRILIVEDDRDTRESLQTLLELAGHDVAAVGDGLEAVAIAGEWQPHVALVDLGLPGLDGCQVARRIRSMPGGKSVRLVAVTGHGQPEDRQRTAEAGFDWHLVKPVDPDEFNRALAAAAG